MTRPNTKEMLILRKAAELGMQPFNPIGECFDSAMHQIIFGEDPPKDVRLYHGIGISNAPGQEGNIMKHAWLQWTTDKGRYIAYDSTWGVMLPADRYREHLQISYEVYYTRDEAFALWRKHDYPGPWDPKIMAVGK